MAISDKLFLSVANSLLQAGGVEGDPESIAAVLKSVEDRAPGLISGGSDTQKFFKGLDEKGLRSLGSKITRLSGQALEDGPLRITGESVIGISDALSRPAQDAAGLGAIEKAGETRMKRDRLGEIFGARDTRQRRGKGGRTLPASSTPFEDFARSEKRVFSDLDLDLTEEGRMRRGGVTAYDEPIGPKRQGKLRSLLPKKSPVKLGTLGKVAGAVGIPLMIYEILSDIGSDVGEGSRGRQMLLQGQGNILNEMMQAGSSSELAQSEQLQRIATAGAEGSFRPSQELQSIIAADQAMLQDLKQNVSPSITEAYAKAGLL